MLEQAEWLHYQLISDTVFIGVNNSPEDLSKLIKLSTDLLNKSILISLPVRGAISFGDYIWGKLTYGQAVIDAHQLEQNQNWIGICLSSMISIDNPKNHNIVNYLVPMKPTTSNKLITYYTISWQVPSFEKLVDLTTQGGQVAPNQYMDWDWATKISNTAMFGLYLEILKVENKKGNIKVPNQYHGGYHPFHLIDLILRNSIKEPIVEQ